MTDPVISGDGAEAQPSAPAQDTVTPSPEVSAEAELDAKVRESLGDHYVPLESDPSDPEAKQPEEKKEEEEKPEGATPPAPPEGKTEEAIEMPPIPKPEPTASRLDKRVATLYLQNLLLSGEKTVPTLEEVVEDLKRYPMEQKIEALHFHRLRQKELKGLRPTGREELEPEDSEAIRDAEREAIRQEVLAEEHERKVKQSFVGFIDAHPELDETKKEYQPTIARAVETLWRGGMPIEEALETVTSQIAAVRESAEKAEKKEKQKALSGAVSASGDANPSTGGPSWADMARLQKEDPDEWERLIASGYTPKS